MTSLHSWLSWDLGFLVSKLGKYLAKWNELFTQVITLNPVALEESCLMPPVLLVICKGPGEPFERVFIELLLYAKAVCKMLPTPNCIESSQTPCE